MRPPRGSRAPAEVFVSGLGVAGVELHGLADIYFSTEDNGPAFRVRTDDAADEEIPMTLLASVLVDHKAHVEPPIGKELAVPIWRSPTSSWRRW